MKKEKMLPKIYEVVADKTLSLGCTVYDKDWWYTVITRLFTCSGTVRKEKDTKENVYVEYSWVWWDTSIKRAKENLKIIWLPVMIWDVLDWIEPLYWTSIKTLEQRNDLLYYRKEKRKPLEDQTEDCIKYVYDLINKKATSL